MAQLTFDTNDPDDMKLLARMVSAGIVAPAGSDSNVDLTAAIDSLMSSLGTEARDLVAQFLIQTKDGATTTLKDVATALVIPEDKAKARKMSLGRSVKRMQREFPGTPDPIEGRSDKVANVTRYWVVPDVRVAIIDWFQLKEPATPAVPETTPPAGVATNV